MSDRAKAFALLGDDQIELLRAQARMKHEARFLTPQLLEHVTILNQRVQEALRSIEAARAIANELASEYQAGEAAPTECPTCHDESVRTAVSRLRVLLAEERGAPREHVTDELGARATARCTHRRRRPPAR